jgi:LacI family transcriptional regulator
MAGESGYHGVGTTREGESTVTVDLRAVAEASGVSISTVSRALSGSPRVSPKTRQRVMKIAESLGYLPNVVARGLRTRQSKLIGLVIPNLVSFTFVQLFSELQKGFRAHGYEIVLSVTNSDPEQELASFHTLRGHQIDGVVVVGSYTVGTEYLRSTGLPSVHLFRSPEEPAGDCISIDDHESTRRATSYLIAEGHRRIAFINGADHETFGGYRAALADAGIEFDDDLVHVGSYDTDTGIAGVDQVLALDDPPTAVFFGCYEVWLSGIPRLQELGRTIASDISIICRDDAPMLRWWRPSISVVDVEIGRIAELAITRLLHSIASQSEGAAPESGRYQVSAKLIQRDSVVAI